MELWYDGGGLSLTFRFEKAAVGTGAGTTAFARGAGDAELFNPDSAGRAPRICS